MHSRSKRYSSTESLRCATTSSCKGVEYLSGRCEVWTRSAGIGATESWFEFWDEGGQLWESLMSACMSWWMVTMGRLSWDKLKLRFILMGTTNQQFCLASYELWHTHTHTHLTWRSNVWNVTASVQLQVFYKSSSRNEGHSCMLTFGDLRDCDIVLNFWIHLCIFVHLKNFRQPGLFSANSSDA